MGKGHKKPPKGERLDATLVRLGLADSKARAQAFILAGKVKVAGETVRVAGAAVKRGAAVTVDSEPAWASRGAGKLLGALQAFDWLADCMDGADCLDIGASTGGFTDVLLRHGAARVVALDVGYGLLHWRLQSDERVHVMDRTNIRHVTPNDLPFQPQLATCDASFISVRRFLPTVRTLLPVGGVFVVLVKPQFELLKSDVPAGGVVRDEALRQSTLKAVQDAAPMAGFAVAGAVDSPVTGPKGNREFLLALRAS